MREVSLRVALIVSTALTALTYAQVARADDLLDLGLLPGTTLTHANGVSADGLVVVGHGDNTRSGTSQAVVWTAGGLTALPFLAGTSSSSANAASADGSVIVGTS